MGKTSAIDASSPNEWPAKAVLLDEALVAHVLERSLLRNDKSDLSKLRRKQRA
jgi:hypothetical protein